LVAVRQAHRLEPDEEKRVGIRGGKKKRLKREHPHLLSSPIKGEEE